MTFASDSARSWVSVGFSARGADLRGFTCRLKASFDFHYHQAAVGQAMHQRARSKRD